MPDRTTVPRACSTLLPNLQRIQDVVVVPWGNVIRIAVEQHVGPFEDHHLYPDYWTDHVGQPFNHAWIQNKTVTFRGILHYWGGCHGHKVLRTAKATKHIAAVSVRQPHGTWSVTYLPVHPQCWCHWGFGGNSTPCSHSWCPHLGCSPFLPSPHGESLQGKYKHRNAAIHFYSFMVRCCSEFGHSLLFIHG